MTSTPVLGSFLAVLFFNYLFIVVDPYESIFDPLRTVTFLGWAAIIWVIPYLWLGRIAYFATVRNIPYYWTVLAMLTALNIVLALLGHFFFIPGSEIVHVISQIGKITGFEAAVLAFLTIYLRDRFAARMSSRPEIIPWFRPTGGIDFPLLLELPAEIRGEVLRMESMNQYVKVTTELGSALVRMPLAKACAQMPDFAGWRIHRSFWVAKKEARSIIFEAGNPRLVVRNGERLPMSRKATTVVKDHLAASSS